MTRPLAHLRLPAVHHIDEITDQFFWIGSGNRLVMAPILPSGEVDFESATDARMISSTPQLKWKHKKIRDRLIKQLFPS